ncbi:PqqD family peptide modification chaperone [Rudanella paleaurantiibacter]|uniref:PqqD family peptide modification chaperone n=1 Tax=Rudanella paleaurantiibacter TaxID=2614655 RepID=A0A7J5U4A2_9BACT|nr:PqqD family protein [Rudanella paleaurantiibacter]KAB7732669.1 PqqD family peptide modification chaperone [Rudanella paleaurantiibacter]
MSFPVYRTNTPAVVGEFFDNEVILVNMSMGHYYSLRDTAATIWQGLDAGLSTEALVQRLVDSYTVEAAEAEAAVLTFLEQLVRQHLVVLTDQPLATKSLDTPSARRPYTHPLLETYTDMQDLLALDPIHDVDPQQGWPIQK